MLITVIIPMYNEKEAAVPCVDALTERLERAAAGSGFSYEILFSDDGSDDGCGELVRQHAAGRTSGRVAVRVIRAERNAGKGAAVRYGVSEAAGDWILYTDCDLAYGADVIPEMVDKAVPDGPDLLIGSRDLHPDGYAGYTPLRRIASRLFLRILSVTAGFGYSDSQCGLKLLRGEAARRIFPECETNGWSFDFEMLLIAERLGCRIEEYPVRVIHHRGSKIHLVRDSIRMFRDVFRIRRSVAKRFPKRTGT